MSAFPRPSKATKITDRGNSTVRPWNTDRSKIHTKAELPGSLNVTPATQISATSAEARSAFAWEMYRGMKRMPST